MPPAVNQSNAHKYEKSKAITDYREFPGRSHFTVGQEGWEAVADYAIEWAVKHAADFNQRYASLRTTETSQHLDMPARRKDLAEPP